MMAEVPSRAALAHRPVRVGAVGSAKIACPVAQRRRGVNRGTHISAWLSDRSSRDSQVPITVSILAGILNRRQDVPLSLTLTEKLERAITRDATADVVVFRDHNVALFKVDVGAYREPAFRSHSSGSVSMLAGEPLLDLGPDLAPGTRSGDLERMHDAFDHEQWSLFSKSQGVYCAVHYEPKSGTVTLVADRLGIRPIHYWIGTDYVIFASALRVLEALSEVPKSMDLVAVTEIAMLGFPVGTRTAYAEISGLKAGEILRLTQDRARSLRYWRWDSIEPSSLPEEALLEEAYDRFGRAVRRRLRRDTAVVATLSGGLDSRCVVAALRDETAQVHTLNLYSVLQSQDQVFAAEFARQAGTIHRPVPVPAEIGFLDQFEHRITDAWQASPPALDSVPERPRLLWKGDGGSVGVGHVFIEPEILAALRAGDVHRGIAEYRSRLVPRLLKSSVSSEVAELIVDDIRAELEDLRYDDPGRSFHMFLMLFEQRYQLAQHFEDMDLHRLEFHLPFFDGDFLSSIVSAPVDLCLAHGFYTDWLRLFPAVVTTVPWQAYPGHRPCPLPIPAGLAYQWDKEFPALVEARRRRLLHVADHVLRADRFPDAILTRRILQLARWMCKAGLRRGPGTIEAADIYHRYWTACGGKFVARPARIPDWSADGKQLPRHARAVSIPPS